MKPAKEFEWLLKLRNCKFVRRGLFRKTGLGGCKNEFEKCLGISENNKTFRKWFNCLVLYGAIEVFEKKNIGGIKEVDTYVINIKKIDKLIEGNHLYSFAYKFFDSKFFIVPR